MKFHGITITYILSFNIILLFYTVFQVESEVIETQYLNVWWSRKGLEVSTLRFKDGHQFYIVNRREPHSKCMGKETSLLDWGGGGCVCVCVCRGVCVRCSLCPTLCDTMDYNLPASSVHGSLQVRTLEWVTISLSRGSSQPRDRTRISCTGRRVLYHWATREPWLAWVFALLFPDWVTSEISPRAPVRQGRCRGFKPLLPSLRKAIWGRQETTFFGFSIAFCHLWPFSWYLPFFLIVSSNGVTNILKMWSVSPYHYHPEKTSMNPRSCLHLIILSESSSNVHSVKSELKDKAYGFLGQIVCSAS